MNSQSIRGLGLRRLSAVTLALLLVAGFLSTIVPLASVSAGNICTLACCAGRMPHAAGSCMNGSCHAAIKLHRKTIQRPTAETFCGFEPMRAQRLFRTTITQRNRQADETRAGSYELVLTKPCPPDCGGTAGSIASNSKGKAVAIAIAIYGQPLNNARADHDLDRAQPLESLCCRHSPRGPPKRFLV
jgi:hypothetical protein